MFDLNALDQAIDRLVVMLARLDMTHPVERACSESITDHITDFRTLAEAVRNGEIYKDQIPLTSNEHSCITKDRDGYCYDTQGPTDMNTGWFPGC